MPDATTKTWSRPGNRKPVAYALASRNARATRAKVVRLLMARAYHGTRSAGFRGGQLPLPSMSAGSCS